MSAKKQIEAKEDPDLLSEFYRQTAELKQQDYDSLTLAQKLMLKAENQTHTVTIDGLEFEVKSLPQVARQKIAKIFESEDAEAMINAIADNFVDPSINKEFLESGFFTKSQISQMFFAILETSPEEIEQITTFRKNKARTSSV